MNRKRATAALIAVLAIAATTLTAWTSLAGASPRSSRARSPVRAARSWCRSSPLDPGYHPSKIAYSGIGSGGGIAAITARTVDFGASDAPLSPDQFKACKGCVQIPWAFSATSIPYNVSGVGFGLKLTGKILAGMYGGSIKYWDNPAIKKINKGVNLPHDKVVPIWRSDGSGTSYNFTDYLSHVSKAWKSSVGKGTQPSFPVGVGARGSSGVAAKLKSTPGGITYVDVAYSLNNHFKIAKIQNRAGKFELPGLIQIRAAAKSLEAAPEQGQLDHGRRPEPAGEDRLPDLHLHLRRPAAQDRQGRRAEEVRRLGTDEGTDLRAEAPLRGAAEDRPAGGPQDALPGPQLGGEAAANVEPAALPAAGFDASHRPIRRRA